jgi:hypothetical protein
MDVTRNLSSQAGATVAPAPISPTEAIRRAMDALGSNSPVPQILEYIQEHFGITGVTAPEEQPAPALPRTDRTAKEPAGGPTTLARKESSPAPSPAPVSGNPAAPRQAPTGDGLGSEGEEDAARKGTAKRGKPKDRPAP